MAAVWRNPCFEPKQLIGQFAIQVVPVIKSLAKGKEDRDQLDGTYLDKPYLITSQGDKLFVTYLDRNKVIVTEELNKLFHCRVWRQVPKERVNVQLFDATKKG